MPALSWLQVDGDRIADERGRTVVLAGVGLGGWMNMENFVTGYPGSEQDIRRLLRATMGEEAYRAFSDTFLTAFFDEADARYLASLGLNSVRIPVNYRHGTTRGEYFDRSVVEETFLRRTRYMRETGTPVWIGEFGPVYPVHPAARPQDTWRYALLRDQLEIYREHGAGWSLWTYKDIGLQGIVHAAPDSPYLRRIRPALEQKQRLGTDSWGGSDAGVRDILDPIDALFEREFPGYEPYPWGRRQHIAGLVRHILLAEPLAERFAQLFEGIAPEEAAEAARSFRFDRTVEREGLAAVLREHLLGPLASGPAAPSDPSAPAPSTPRPER